MAHPVSRKWEKTRNWEDAKSSFSRDENVLSFTRSQAALLNAYHSRVGIDYSYGGWLEDRSTVWAGTYLDETKSYTHLGVDLNAPEGTPIAADHHGYVIRIDDDHPEEGGWGPRILFRLRDAPIILIYAHLHPGILNKVGDLLGPGDILARVGPISHNGGRFPHLHVQCMTMEAWELFTSDPVAWTATETHRQFKNWRGFFPILSASFILSGALFMIGTPKAD
jgi:murein DD-endopeptidase MepM/ murein hydrolase activator NlpD